MVKIPYGYSSLPYLILVFILYFKYKFLQFILKAFIPSRCCQGSNWYIKE